VKHPRDAFFSKGWRKAVVRAERLNWEAGPDELDPGKRRLELEFILPRGSYATVLVKRITAAAGEGAPQLGDSGVDELADDEFELDSTEHAD
jgi:tRNA pseudouridine13 synthase